MLFHVLFSASFWLMTYAKPLQRETTQQSNTQTSTGSNSHPSTSSTSSSLSSAATSSGFNLSDLSSMLSGGVSAQGRIQRVFLDTDTCTPSQQSQINQAWDDAALLAKAAYGGRLDYDYTIPKTEWMGKDWNWGGWWPISSNYRLIINNNIGRQAQLYSDNAPGHVYLYFSCPKQHSVCTPGTIAASSDSNGFFWTNHYTIFCPIFFNKDSMTTSLSRVRNDKQEQMVMDNYWGNQGYSVFHETYHYKTTVSQPRTKDLCYQATGCWEMAADSHRGTGWAYQTADSYALEATAIYVQQYYKTLHPPVPRKYTIALTQNSSTVFQQAANPSNSTPPLQPDNVSSAPPQPTEYYKALDYVPEDLFGSTNNVNASTFQVNSRWKLMFGPPINGSTNATGLSSSPVEPLTMLPALSPNATATSGPHSSATSPSSSSTKVAPSSTTSTKTSPATATASVDMSSAACKSCMGDLGASSCAASDQACLTKQCKADHYCVTCGLDCNTVGQS